MGSQDDHSLFGTSWVPTAFRLAIPSSEEAHHSPLPSPQFDIYTSPRQSGPRASAPKSPGVRVSQSPEDTPKPAEPVKHSSPKTKAKPSPPKTEAKPVSTALAIPDDYIIRDLGLKDVDLVIGGKDPTSGSIVAFPVRRMNLISASTVLADLLKTKPPPFGAGPDSIKVLPYLKLDENALLMERILPFLFNDLDLPKTTDIHFIRAVYQAAYKYKMRRLFDWMTEKLRATWPSASPEVVLNLYAVVKNAEDPDLAAIILIGVLEKYTWTINREGENKWTCDSGYGPKILKDCTDVHGLAILLAIANKRNCMSCKKPPFKEEKPKEDKPKEEAKPAT